MKKIKLISLTLIFSMFLLFGTSTLVYSAGIKTFDDTNKYFFQTNENIETNLYGVKWNKITGETATGEQHINMFSMKTDGVSSKLVVWSAHYQNYRNNRTTLSKLAANYEKAHPGWRVVGGINADQYIMDFGTETISKGQDYYEWQPYYPIIMEGERRFPYTMTGTSSNAIAFTNDGSTNGFIDVNSVEGLYVEIIDESGVVLSKHPVEGVNQSPSASGTTVWFSYVNSKEAYEEVAVNSSNSLYIVSKAEFAYMNNSRNYTYKGHWAVDSVFGRGTIDQVNNSFTLTKGQFVIDSNDSNLTSLLDTNVRVRVQYSYANDALNKVEAASGYHSIQRLNGVDMDVNGSYNTSTYSRSVFGIKEDGTYVLITADMTTNKKIAGLNGWEINALLKQYGVVTAYQDDGGGSVTAVWRNAEGGFDCVNVPRDGGERSILTGLFFVVKDSGLSVDSVEATDTSLTFNVNTSKADMTKITDIYCTVNGITEKVVDGKVTINGLEKMTEYTYSFTYDTKDASGVDAMLNGTTKTAKTLPQITDWKIDIKDDKITFEPIVEDPDEAIEYIRIIYNDERYPYIDEPIEIKLDTTSLDKIEYTVSIAYNLFDVNDTSKKVVTDEVKTLVLKEDKPTDPDDPDIPDPLPDEPEIKPTPTPSKDGCKKELQVITLSIISLSCIALIFRKRK
ncbi:MAG: phosphodiester glycosidase family protein [Bacilli bacterium]|nr:phosphodiester glycosidase family protein [Bacilli bacterium]